MKRIYPSAILATMRGEIDWEDDTLVACLVDTSLYAFSASHTTLSSILEAGSPPQDARIGDDAVLSGKTLSTVGWAGVLDADDAVFTSVPAGKTVGAVVVYAARSPIEDSPLLWYDSDATGIPLSTDGSDVTYVFDNGDNKAVAMFGPY